MSFPEYHQTPQDHRSAIILVHPIGGFVSKSSFSQIWAELKKVKEVPIGKDNRSLSIRFVPNYPIENNEWGDFQLHRKVIGLICLAQHNEKLTGKDLEELHSDLRNLYDSTLLDSRLVILGLPRSPLPYKNEIVQTEKIMTGDLVIDPNHYDMEQRRCRVAIPDLLDRCNDSLKQIAAEMSETTRKTILSYSDVEEACSYINADIEAMCQSLFYVLESKRLEATKHLKQPSLIMAPFERSTAVIADLETRAGKNRFMARSRKRIGDLCLLVDLPHEAVIQFQASLELLEANGDEFWIGGALEGLAVASSFVLTRELRQSSSLDGNVKRNSSFSNTGRSSPGLLLDPSITLHNSFNHLDLASSRPKLHITFDEIITRYRGAIYKYCKFPAAAIIEMEASLKATRLLIEHKKTKMATEFLHRVAYVNFDDISYTERVERYDVMGDLYHQLKFHRKAAFFKRVAAMHCVSPALPSPAWADCYTLLLKALPGFKMSFNSTDYRVAGHASGWPQIRVRVFHELIYAARQLGDNAAIVRHVSLCLHTMYKYMLDHEIQELVHLLETYTKDNRDDGLPIRNSAGVLLPPVSFSSIPLLRKFELLKLPPQLEPHKRKEVLPSESVFIYSPLNFTRQTPRSLSVTEYEFGWVQGNSGSVEISLFNPLRLELKLKDLSLLVEGVEFQPHPSSHTLPADSGPHAIIIMGVPLTHGTLKILGYQMTLFGVVSRCLFSDLPHIKQKVFSVNVAPSMPALHLSSSLPKSPYMVTGGDNAIVTSAILQVYVGEQRKCQILLKNNGTEPITDLDVTFESEKFQDLLTKILVIDMTAVSASLPLPVGSETALTIKTVGSLRLSDLPSDMLLTPHGSEQPQGASSALLESLLKVTYTGLEGRKHLYYRESIMSIDTVLTPSINILSKSLKSVDKERCQAAYEVFNESNMALRVKSSDKSVLLKPMQSEWVECRLQKTACSASVDECKQRLEESVCLCWESDEKRRVGLISTDRLDWQPAELDTLRMRPFSIVGAVTKNSCSRYLTGQPINFSYTISNTSDKSFTDVELRVVLYQEIASSRCEVDVDTAYVNIGPSHHTIDKIDSGVSIELKSTVAIFYSGRYTVECQCLHNGVFIPGVDSGLSILVT